MGIDLELLPFYSPDTWFSHEILQVNRDYKLHDKISELPSYKVPENFRTYLSRDSDYEEPHYGVTEEDAYGDELKYVFAIDLKKVNIPGPVGAYIQAMQDDDKIALFWS